MVIDDLLDSRDVILSVNVELLLLSEVQVDAVLWGGNQEDGLINVGLEEKRLSSQWGLELVKHCSLISLKVKFKDAVDLGENDRVLLYLIANLLKVELHAHLRKDVHFLDEDSLFEVEAI